MKKSFISLAVLISLGAQAQNQTVTGTLNTDRISSINVGGITITNAANPAAGSVVIGGGDGAGNVGGTIRASQHVYTKNLNADGTTTLTGNTFLRGPTQIVGNTLQITGTYSNGVLNGSAIDLRATNGANLGTITGLKANTVGGDWYTDANGVQQQYITINPAVNASNAATVGDVANTVRTAKKQAQEFTNSKVNAETASRIAGDADLDSRKADKTAVASEVTRVDGRIDTTNGRVTVVEGKVVDLRTDLGTETAARIEGDKRAAAEANSYANAGDRRTLIDANSYSDAGDAATLNTAQNYADAGDRRTLNQANSYTDKQIGKVRQEVAQVRKEVDAVGAVAMAASVVGGVSVADGKKTAVTAAVGSYGSTTAIAVGVTRIVAPNARVFGTISRASGSKTGVGAGASFSF